MWPCSSKPAPTQGKSPHHSKPGVRILTRNAQLYCVLLLDLVVVPSTSRKTSSCHSGHKRLQPARQCRGLLRLGSQRGRISQVVWHCDSHVWRYHFCLLYIQGNAHSAEQQAGARGAGVGGERRRRRCGSNGEDGGCEPGRGVAYEKGFQVSGVDEGIPSW